MGLCAAQAQAALKPAPGAPGAIHTWAPADKHGFGSARQARSPVAFTLRQASLTEVYYPDLSTPGFRGLQFAVADRRGRLTRETVDDDPRHIERVAPGVRARVEAVDGTLAYRQVTSTSRWRLTKTWITDPARATVLARVRFESLTGQPLRLYVLADPAPGDDGNDDLGTSYPHWLAAFDDAGASVVAATPDLHGTTSGYRGAASDPWKQLVAANQLTAYDAEDPGNVVQGAQTALDGQPGNQTMTLAIGLGQKVSAARSAAAASLDGGFAGARDAYDAGWAAYLASLKS